MITKIARTATTFAAATSTIFSHEGILPLNEREGGMIWGLFATL